MPLNCVKVSAETKQTEEDKGNVTDLLCSIIDAISHIFNRNYVVYEWV